jgi:hypothetical protein
LIIADKNEEIFIFKTDCKNLQNKKKKFKFFIQKKINFFFYDRKINFLSFVKKKIFFLNFFYNSLLFSIDLKRKKKKLILVLKKKMHILNLKSKKKTGMLILTNNNILYFFFRKKIFLIFKLPKYNNISFLIKTNSFYQQNQFQSKISPLLFLSKYISEFGIVETCLPIGTRATNPLVNLTTNSQSTESSFVTYSSNSSNFFIFFIF